MELAVKVIPRAATTEFAGELADGTVKIRVHAAPEGGKANEALCDFLARHYRVPRNAVTIVAGTTSTRKRIRIATE